MKDILWVFLCEFQSRECLLYALDYSMHLLGEIAKFLGVYKLPILAVGDCFTDYSCIRLQKLHHFGQNSAYAVDGS